jgi:hypothetical protein
MSIQIRTYLQNKHNWNDKTIESIWWLTHEKAILSKSPEQRLFIQKFIHNKLPTNKRQKLYYPYKNDICSSCNTHKESQEHILQCTACPNRNIIQSKYIIQLRHNLDKYKIHPSINNIIIQNTIEWLENRSPPTTIEIEPNASKELLSTIQLQQDIGWNHWFYGRYVQQWGHIFNYEIDNTQPHRKNITAESWDKEIILLTWEFAHNMWISRNQIEHDTDGNTNKKTKEKIIEHIIGISQAKGSSPYQMNELTYDKLIKMPIPNLKSIQNNIKMKRRREKNNKNLEKNGSQNNTEIGT